MRINNRHKDARASLRNIYVVTMSSNIYELNNPDFRIMLSVVPNHSLYL